MYYRGFNEHSNLTSNAKESKLNSIVSLNVNRK